MLPEHVMDLLIAYWNGEMSEEELDTAFGPTKHGEHGEVIDCILSAYGDWIGYEDGYGEYISLGD